LINILRGEMSLVGPRPERPEFVRLFARDIAFYEVSG
jgi:lipopolysaccharide/colanic/teichoic acid biosynthesis glycosyltransferase